MRCFNLCLLIVVVAACSKREPLIKHGNLEITFNEKMYSQVQSLAGGSKKLSSGFTASEYLVNEDNRFTDFSLTHVSETNFSDSVGEGVTWLITGAYADDTYNIEKRISIRLYDSVPDMAFFKVIYINHSERPLKVNRWVNHHYAVEAGSDSIPFWSFQGESTGARKDWVLPVKAGFSQRNYMGMNDSDYGGGIPVLDLWRRDQGIAIGHSEIKPKLVSLPVAFDGHDNQAKIRIERQFEDVLTLDRGDTLNTLETFVTVHGGDYYRTLQKYSQILEAKGMKPADPLDEAFEASWCAWGYMREFTLDEIKGTIPKVKELGLHWVTIDDGFQQAEGDWHVNTKKFPKGDKQMRQLVDDLHNQGMKVMLWWAPLAADPDSKLLASNPDMKLLTRDGAPQYITWWDSYYLSPAYEKTIAHTKEMLKLFLEEWDVDGLKMDGQHLNAVPPDHHPDHSLEAPEDAFENLPEFYEMIYNEANKIKPGVLIQNCPCGTCMSVFNMPYMNQAVASDPLNSWQIRLKGKTYKALIPQTAYFGDHVELSDGRSDFASSFGIGAVLGSKFTWPSENPFVKEDNLLTPDKEEVWKKWFNLYDEKMLSREKYLGELYDIGFDIPETHVIAKGDTLHYAFYNTNWSGEVELRGLTEEKYVVRDYFNDKFLGTVQKDRSKINVAFQKHLLIEVYPVK